MPNYDLLVRCFNVPEPTVGWLDFVRRFADLCGRAAPAQAGVL